MTRKCELCPTEFETIKGKYCPACRHRLIVESNHRRLGGVHQRSHGGSHKVEMTAPAKCPKCKQFHPTPVKRIPTKTIYEYCPGGCKEAVEDCTAGCLEAATFDYRLWLGAVR